MKKRKRQRWREWMKDRKREIRWIDKLNRKVEMTYSILEAAQYTRCNEPRFSIPVFYTPTCIAYIKVENGDHKTGIGDRIHVYSLSPVFQSRISTHRSRKRDRKTGIRSPFSTHPYLCWATFPWLTSRFTQASI